MNYAKRFLFLLIAAVSAFLCACTGQTVTYELFEGSYWLNSPEETSIPDKFSETCVYDVVFRQGSNSALTASFTDESNLTTTLSTEDIDGKKYYRFETSLTVKGEYNYNGKSVPVNDSVSSVCWFSGLNEKFYPLKSTKSVASLGLTGSEKQVSFYYTSYNQTIEYTGNKATVKVTPGKEMPEELKSEELKVSDSPVSSTERVYDKIKSPYIDNELAFFFTRAAKLTEGFNATYTSIDALSQKNHSMRVSVAQEKSKSEIKIANFAFAGGNPSERKFVCYKASIAINESFSGSPLVLYLAGTNDNNMLVSAETSLPYSIGTLVYTIRSFNHVN